MQPCGVQDDDIVFAGGAVDRDGAFPETINGGVVVGIGGVRFSKIIDSAANFVSFGEGGLIAGDSEQSCSEASAPEGEGSLGEDQVHGGVLQV